MAFLYHHQQKKLLSIAVMGCLCPLFFQSVTAAGNRKTTSTKSAYSKSKRTSAKQHWQKPAAASTDTGWTTREPSHQEFATATTEKTGNQPQASTKGETQLPTNHYGYPMPSTGSSSVTQFDSASPQTAIALSNMEANPASEGLYDASVKPYVFGPTSFELNYARENDRSLEATRDILAGKRAFGIGQNRFIESPLDRDTWHVGMNYAVGKGSFNAAVDYTRMRSDSGSDGSGNDPADLRSISFGYTHNVSENTSFYGSVTHTEYDVGDSPDKTGTAPGEDNINQVNVGIKHRF